MNYDSERELIARRGGEVVGLNPSIRIYRYNKGQFFDQHCGHSLFSIIGHVEVPNVKLDDESNVLTLNTKPTYTSVRTTWTLLLYLTSPATGCQGGETVFYPDEIQFPGRKNLIDKEFVVGLETGMVLLHKHGNDCMLVSDLIPDYLNVAWTDTGTARRKGGQRRREVGHQDRLMRKERKI